MGKGSGEEKEGMRSRTFASYFSERRISGAMYNLVNLLTQLVEQRTRAPLTDSRKASPPSSRSASFAQSQSLRP